MSFALALVLAASASPQAVAATPVRGGAVATATATAVIVRPVEVRMSSANGSDKQAAGSEIVRQQSRIGNRILVEFS